MQLFLHASRSFESNNVYLQLIVCSLQLFVASFGWDRSRPPPGMDTVRLTSIDHPQIEGAYISGLCAANFIFLVCVC